MTVILRSKKYSNYLIPVKEKDINDYFKKVKAQNWQLKYYLNHHLKLEVKFKYG